MTRDNSDRRILDAKTPILFSTDIRVLEFRTERWIERLTPERRAKMERYHGREDRLRSLAAGLLLQNAFGNRTASIRRNRFGKPFFDGGPFFNLSHSGNRAVLAVDSRHPIGCDVQCREDVCSDMIAKHLFHPEEYEILKRTAREDRQSVFYRFWTLKESYQKMIGKGFSLPSSHFRFELTPTPRLLETPEKGLPPFFHLSEEDDCTLAVCGLSDLTKMERIEIGDWEPL